MSENYRDLLCALLDCGYLDLSIIEDTEYDFYDIVEEAKMNFGDVTLGSIFAVICDMAMSEIEDEINSVKENLKDELEEENITEEEYNESIEELDRLDVWEDFETYFNYTDSHITCVNHQDIYDKYLSDEAISRIENNCGFTLENLGVY